MTTSDCFSDFNRDFNESKYLVKLSLVNVTKSEILFLFSSHAPHKEPRTESDSNARKYIGSMSGHEMKWFQI